MNNIGFFKHFLMNIKRFNNRKSDNMGWFKNLKKIFGNNESEEYEEYEDYGNSESERREPINGQMETKVTYQYPKGNFRFPLRVEEKSNISTQTSASKIQENNKQHYHQNRQSSSITKNHPNVDKPTERSFNKTVEISTPLEQRQTVQTKIQPKIKQPFRPTEIPSPVYGFRRPPRRNTLNSKNQTNDIHKQEDKDLQLHSDHKSIPTRTDEVKTDNSALKKKIPMKLDKEDQKALHEIEDLLINSEEEVSLQKELWDARNLHTVEQSDLETAFPNSMNQTEIDEQEAEDQYLSEQRHKKEVHTNQLGTMLEERQELQEIISQNINQNQSNIETEIPVEQRDPVVGETKEPQEVTDRNIGQKESRIEEEMIVEQRDSVVEEPQESQEVSQNIDQRESRIEEEMIAEQKDSVVEEPQESQEVSQNLNQRESRIEEEMIAEQRDSVVEEPQESQEVSQNLDQRESRIDGEILTELIDQAVEGSEILNPNQTDKTNEAEQPIIEQSESEEEIPSHPLINETAEISPHLLDENEIQNKEDHSEIPEDKNENGMYTEFKSDSINDPQDIEAENVENDEEMNLKSSQAPVRTHIPFNVIMLKKDREKIEKKQAVAEVQTAQKQTAVTVNTEEYVEEDYVFPGIQLLNPPVHEEMDKDWLNRQSELLDDTLLSFNVRARVVNVSQGPSVTRFEVQPEPGVKVNKITNLSDDIKLSLAAKDIRMEAPIPGKHTIGIELPNAKSRPVYISEIISSEIFEKSESPLTAVLGLDISGSPVITDLRKMPHGLIAGATGSGKSVCINSILISLLYKSTPDQLKLLLIDPKMVELAPYNNIPHLVSPVITDVKAATAALKWAVEEMERRYELFAHTGVREIGRYNEMAEENRQFNQKLPFIVIVIDELADLMMMAPADVEEAICRIAQKARACGIHLIIATQRPSVDVITGLIKANVPTRIAFSVSSQIDSRTIIDISGAEKLLGRGDMLFLGNGTSKPIRLQGTYVSDEEIDQVVAHVRAERKPDYLFEQEELLKKAIIQDEEDEIFHDVCEFVMEQGAASTSLIQRNFRIGYNRAARLMEMMEQQGIISEAKGSKPRDILMSREEYDILTGATETN